MGIAEPPRRLAGNEKVQRLIGEHARHAVEQRHVDLLALARAFPLCQGRLHRDNTIEPGENICEGNADLLRFTIRLARQVHDAAHALDDVVVAGAVSIGPVLPEAGDRAIDEPRIDFPQAFIIETVFGEAADLEVLEQNVGLRGKPAHRLLPLCGRKVQNDRPLAAVARVKIGGIQPFVAFAFHEGRSPGPGVVSGRALDLDDVGAEIGKGLPDPGARQYAGKFEHPDALERRFHGGAAQKKACSPVWARPRISACTSCVPS